MESMSKGDSKFGGSIETSASAPSRVSVERGAQSGAGPERALLVDDDLLVRKVVMRMLASLGYVVVEAGDGTEALDIFRAQHATLDLVLLDLVMPGMNGKTVLEAMHAINPEVAIVMSSGQEPADLGIDLDGCGHEAFLRKPYRRSELATLLTSIPASEVS